MLRPLVLAALVAAAPAPGQTLDDRHLPVIPRTAAETARIAKVLTPPEDFTGPEPFEANPAGAATVRARATADAFSLSSANMPFGREMAFKLGNALFRKTWVAAPSSTLASDGLGPLYNARACQDCHLKDGRGHPPEGPQDARVSMFLRLSRPAETPEAAAAGIAEWIATRPDPVYGGQLQDLAAPGHAAEGRMEVDYTDEPVTLADGTVVTLRRPTYAISNPGYGPLPADLMISPRVAPQMIGLGLLEAIPAADILAHEDPDDADGDGISGRAQIVPSARYGVPMLGRFGLKAGKPTVEEQSAGAFSGDMSLSTPLHPDPWGECTAAQPACRSAPHGQEPGIRDGLEVDAESLDLVAFYSRNLGVPERRNIDDPQVLQGKGVFHALNCTGCHVPKHVTHRLKGQPEQSFQLIWPYTDLLLHDMGPGLADGRPEGRATGSEWRTPPLWGIGLTATVSGHTQFLHDGRARSLSEAILWHGGEAQAARDGFAALTKADRDALIAFLESL
ncbi:di-heme oxidoredictase family protein [Ruixingdingia sedimenti]|uniref:Di-heme oxidoredictase family protein n=1 Tax=Ruixingdingia sedimenti TaxID=3073604 RepID=A0ABU1F7V1_9RHOB|nr:di-heme oxidoredictase family protein [Xinfangfangia sp. LG-4]MDR5652524.1 di-heme oxidoredictase family protein [Xinfangfangia sp. LG-4]